MTVFFFTYCAFEVPSNLCLKIFRPSIWLPSIMVAWGIVMTLMGIVQNFKGLLIARLFLGVAEAGLYPGVAYYITMWYCRSEGQFRQAMFFSAASVAGAFSGLLAFAIAVSGPPSPGLVCDCGGNPMLRYGNIRALCSLPLFSHPMLCLLLYQKFAGCMIEGAPSCNMGTLEPYVPYLWFLTFSALLNTVFEY